MTASKKNLANAIQAEAATLHKYRLSPLGWVPVVAVGRISKNLYSVGISYQPAGTKVGDTFEAAYTDYFIGGRLQVVTVRE